MIKIKTNGVHSKEKNYIFDIIFSDILGLKISYEISESNSYEIILPNNKQIIIPDKFLSSQENQKQWKEYEYPDLSFNTNIKIKNKHTLFGLYGEKDFNVTNESISINNDIIGTAFIFLSRIEELNSNQDQFNRYQYKNSLADRFDIITRPIVNEYINFIKESIQFLCPDIVFKDYKFNIILSHDIDTIKKWTWKNLVKHTIFNFRKKDFFKQYLDFFQSQIDYKSDPYYNFNSIMNRSESNKLSSLFLFMALKKNEFDFRYPLKKIIPALDEIEKRDEHDFGIHISKLAYNDLDRCSEEISRLSKLAKSEIIYSRQHYLMFDPKKTWSILNANGIKYDLSLGYPEIPGFRCGICYPFKTFDLVNKEKLDLVEIPLIVMDVSILDYLKDIEFDSQLNKILNNVKKYNGVLNILWHNDQFDKAEFDKHKTLFNSIINK
jgi:hypothetical protein